MVQIHSALFMSKSQVGSMPFVCPWCEFAKSRSVRKMDDQADGIVIQRPAPVATRTNGALRL